MERKEENEMPTYKYQNTQGQILWRAVFNYKDWTGEIKQKCKRGFKTQKEAKQWELKFLAESQADLEMEFGEFVKIYMNDKKAKLKQRTIENKKYILDTHILPYVKNLSVSQITPAIIIKWQNEMMQKGYSEAYLYMLHKEFNAVLNHAVKYYGLKDNPCRKVGKMGNSKSKSINFWTVDEYKAVSNVLKERDDYVYYVLFDVLFYTGVRVGEALALNKNDFDFETNTLSVTKTYYRRNRMDYITKPKTEQSIRIVTVPQFLMDEVKELLERTYGYEAENRIFGMTVEAVQHKIKRVAELAKVKRIRVHDLRHSHISMLIEKGVAPLAIAERVGHDVQITLSVYAHLYPNKQKEIADMLEIEEKKSIREI